MAEFDELLKEVRACRACEAHLPEGPRPVLQASPTARILIAGQAPGIRVHKSGLPFDDASGRRLRDWLGLSIETFYDAAKIAILPMGFCYPGTGYSGDRPPRPECASLWRARLLDSMPSHNLTLLLGQYATTWHLPEAKGATLTSTVRKAKKYLEKSIVPLPHPSPRNNIWLKKNPWFEIEILPLVKEKISRALDEV